MNSPQPLFPGPAVYRAKARAAAPTTAATEPIVLAAATPLVVVDEAPPARVAEAEDDPPPAALLVAVEVELPRPMARVLFATPLYDILEKILGSARD